MCKRRVLSLVSMAGLSLSISCTPAVRRTGYDTTAHTVSSARCEPVVQRTTPLTADQYEVLGEVQVKDTGFSTRCSERDALRILHREACEVGADLIDVTEEQPPDFISTCFRARARLLHIRDRAVAAAQTSDPHYASIYVEERVTDDKRRTRTIIISAVAAGVAAGLTAGLIVGLSKP